MRCKQLLLGALPKDSQALTKWVEKLVVRVHEPCFSHPTPLLQIESDCKNL
jgi:hypothetical protein